MVSTQVSYQVNKCWRYLDVVCPGVKKKKQKKKGKVGDEGQGQLLCVCLCVYIVDEHLQSFGNKSFVPKYTLSPYKKRKGDESVRVGIWLMRGQWGVLCLGCN